MLGLKTEPNVSTARLSSELKANDSRQDYLRARVQVINGERYVEPFAVQDSSMLSTLAMADALIVRAPNAPPAKPGDSISILFLD
jgi:molybdopterin molybdotransferase